MGGKTSKVSPVVINTITERKHIPDNQVKQTKNVVHKQHAFLKHRTNQAGGSDADYHKYMKYKTKYLELKNKLKN